MYFILPRLLARPWPHRSWIWWHLGLSLGGIAIYFIFLTIGGLLQGAYMLDASKSFEESVKVTHPYLWARSIGGTLMTLAHFLFAWHVVKLVRQPLEVVPVAEKRG